MPWKSRSKSMLREEFVKKVLSHQVSKSELRRRYGISRPTGDKWIGRAPRLLRINVSSNQVLTICGRPISRVILRLKTTKDVIHLTSSTTTADLIFVPTLWAAKTSASFLPFLRDYSENMGCHSLCCVTTATLGGRPKARDIRGLRYG